MIKKLKGVGSLSIQKVQNSPKMRILFLNMSDKRTKNAKNAHFPLLFAPLTWALPPISTSKFNPRSHLTLCTCVMIVTHILVCGCPCPHVI